MSKRKATAAQEARAAHEAALIEIVADHKRKAADRKRRKERRDWVNVRLKIFWHLFVYAMPSIYAGLEFLQAIAARLYPHGVGHP